MNLAQRDAEYRAALGLDDDEPIPNELGQTSGHSHNPSARRGSRFYTSEPPPDTNLGACDLELRHRRRSINARAVPRGDVDGQLDEYAEAIEHAELARDGARNKRERQAIGAYVVRLKDRRDALMRSAGRESLV